MISVTSKYRSTYLWFPVPLYCITTSPTLLPHNDHFPAIDYAFVATPLFENADH